MEEIKLLAEVLKYSFPALAVMLTVYFLQKQKKDEEIRKEGLAIRGQALSKIVPLRITAYERAILFLERISPENLLIRMEPQGIKAKKFWAELQMTVREEYEHNLAQQLYISPEGWSELIRAKDSVLTLINECGKTVNPEASGIDLAKRILAVYKETESAPTHAAILFLKEDFQRVFKMIK